jgi:hypothetical protein
MELSCRFKSLLIRDVNFDWILKRWSAFERYAHNGHLPIDNNTCENTIRPIALGKKNWLFVGSERAGKRVAAIQSLLGSAKLNGINPTQWLNETLEKLPTWPYSRITPASFPRRSTEIKSLYSFALIYEKQACTVRV